MNHKDLKGHKENMDMETINNLSNKVIGLALEVHKNLGPGLLESAYKQCLAYELNKNGIKFTLEQPIPLKYKETLIDCSFRADMIVENCIIIELKTVEKLLPIHEAQLMTYLRISGIRLGLLFNFNTRLFKNGIQRIIM